MTTRELPSADSVTEDQRRGWACVWCRAPLGLGRQLDLGQQRVTPRKGAAYSWFPRACVHRAACAEREEAGRAAPQQPARALPPLGSLTFAQMQGRACVWCRQPLTSGAVSAGVIVERDGAHVLDTEVWAGPCCVGSEPTV